MEVNKMFSNSKIDNLFINWLQCAVRQIELYTSFEKRNIVNVVLSIMKWLIFIAITSSFLSIFFVKETMFFDFLCSFVLVWILYLHKKLHNKEQNNNTFPQEIVTRKFYRVCGLSWLLFYTAIFILVDVKNSIVDFNSVVFIILLLVVIFSEYLLCTISLPPGEKQKMMEKKEMKNMVPSPIRN